jgi:sulfoxide reductase heme-binding subunit YedZ
MFAVTRSTGIVAMALMVLSLVWGFAFSSRATGKRLRPNWWLDLHNWLGGLALSFTIVHIVAALLDAGSGIGLLDVFIPGTSVGGWSITWGVLATYVTAAVVFTTWPRRWKNRRWWRVVHVLSVVGTALALVHSYQSGSDSARFAFQAGMVIAVGVGTYGLGLRLSTLRPQRTPE